MDSGFDSQKRKGNKKDFNNYGTGNLSITYGNFSVTITVCAHHIFKKGTYVARVGTVRSFGGKIHIISMLQQVQ